MVATNPKPLSGPWKIGYALDVQTLSSDYLGDNQYGHPQFDTKRSEIGELLNRLKYKSDRSVLEAIVETAVGFIQSQAWQVEVVVPVPPSRKGRLFQPVTAIAEAIAKSLRVDFCQECIAKVKDTPELKKVYDLPTRMDLLANAHAVTCDRLDGRSVLVFDDLYRSGATLRSVVNAVTGNCRVKAVYALTLTTSRKLR